MPSFSYTAIDTAGKQVSGNIVVRNKSDVYRELESKTLTPIRVNAEADGKAEKKKRSFAIGGSEEKHGPTKLKRPELVLFTEELADLLDLSLIHI